MNYEKNQVRNILVNRVMQQIDMHTNKVIQEYGTLTEAAIATKISAGNISSNARGKNSHAGGYCWQWRELAEVEFNDWNEYTIKSLEERKLISQQKNMYVRKNIQGPSSWTVYKITKDNKSSYGITTIDITNPNVMKTVEKFWTTINDLRKIKSEQPIVEYIQKCKTKREAIKALKNQLPY